MDKIKHCYAEVLNMCVFINKYKRSATQWGGNGLKSGQDNGSNDAIICLHAASKFQTAAYDIHMHPIALLNLHGKIINIFEKYKPLK
jgi:hypothetical protein